MLRALLVLLALAAPLRAQEYPAYLTPYVNDFADLLDDETEARITGRLQDARAETGIEMTVVTIRALSDYGSPPSLESFATGLFNSWGVGDPERNDGVMILVSLSDRRMRIELGAGYPRAFDSRAQKVIDEYFLPWFRDGAYAEGIETGTTEAIRRLRLVFTDTGPTFTSRLRNEATYRVDGLAASPFVLGILGLLGLGGSFFGIRAWDRRRGRRCAACGRAMTRLDEEADDAHLVPGQRTEERLRSRDYDVWHCAADGRVSVIGYRNWFSRYVTCGACGYRTLGTTTTTLSAATTSSTGQARVDGTCSNCGHQFSRSITLPKRSESSSSSSGGFNGGSSSGGGASGSW